METEALALPLLPDGLQHPFGGEGRFIQPHTRGVGHSIGNHRQDGHHRRLTEGFSAVGPERIGKRRAQHVDLRRIRMAQTKHLLIYKSAYTTVSGFRSNGKRIFLAKNDASSGDITNNLVSIVPSPALKLACRISSSSASETAL